jgi:hypothetical protein
MRCSKHLTVSTLRLGAGEKVRVARSLADLPLIDKAFSEEKISFSKVRAMTRVATPGNEKFLLQIAEYGTADSTMGCYTKGSFESIGTQAVISYSAIVEMK